MWHLTLVRPRRVELCGLRWTDIDFEAQTISIEVTRVVVNGEVVEGDTKSENSTRVLPLTPGVAGGAQGRHAHAGRGAEPFAIPATRQGYRSQRSEVPPMA